MEEDLEELPGLHPDHQSRVHPLDDECGECLRREVRPQEDEVDCVEEVHRPVRQQVPNVPEEE